MKLWVRNAIFAVFCLLAAGFVIDLALKRRPFAAPKDFHAAAYGKQDFRESVDKLDRAFAERWSYANVEPAERAPELALMRRLSLALTGTVPSLEEIRAAEGANSQEKLQWWISHLLEDRRSSDYLAERFARAWVGVEQGPFIIYRRHRLVTWLSDQLHANRPYDEVVRELITSEGIWTTKPQVNFITVTVDQNNEEEGPDEVKLAGRVSRAFLGVRLDCVECHDDLFGDRWKQKDFHQLASFFARAEMSMTGVRDNAEKNYEKRYLGKRQKELVPAEVPFQRELLPKEGSLRGRLAEWVTHPDNRPFARAVVNRVWALMFNQPLHQPIDDIPLEGPLPAGLEILADDLIAHRFDLQRLIRVIAATKVFQLDSRATDGQAGDEQEAQLASFPMTRLLPEQMARSVLQCANLNTINAESHVLVRVIRYFQQEEFLKRYGDAGEDEFGDIRGTIPQRLVMMNGKLVHERTKEDFIFNASTRIAAAAPDDATAIETAYLATLTRRPTSDEAAYFLKRMGEDGAARKEFMEDLYWTLMNSTEFSWNH